MVFNQERQPMSDQQLVDLIKILIVHKICVGDAVSIEKADALLEWVEEELLKK